MAWHLKQREKFSLWGAVVHGGGGGKGGGSAPSAPDPAATAQAQAGANKEAVHEQALVNQVGTSGPWGKTYWTGDVGSPDRTQVTELSPSGQSQLDAQNYISGELGNYGKQLSDQVAKGPATFDMSGLPQAPWQKDYSNDVGSLEKATYDRSYNLLKPQMQQAQDDLETKLANQGITLGSDAYTKAKNMLAQQQAQQLDDLSLGSVSAGRAEQSRLYGQDMTSRNQALSDLLLQRQEPMNELSTILQGKPSFSMPQGVMTYYQVNPADYTGAANMAYQGALNSYNTAAQQRQGAMGNLLGLGGLGVGIAGLF